MKQFIRWLRARRRARLHARAVELEYIAEHYGDGGDWKALRSRRKAVIIRAKIARMDFLDGVAVARIVNKRAAS